MLKIISWFLTFLLFFYIILGVIVFVNQEEFIYYPNSNDFYFCDNFDKSEMMSVNGTRFYYKERSDKVVIVYHGNAGTACDRDYYKDLDWDVNYSTIIVEYSGYAGDKSKINREILERDVRNINSFLLQSNLSQVAYVGEGFGSYFAIYHQTLRTPEKLILVSPFDTLDNVFHDKLPMYPSVILKEEYDSETLLKGYQGRILILHGAEDQIIRKERSESLANVNTKRIIISGAHHNDIMEKEESKTEYVDFLNS